MDQVDAISTSSQTNDTSTETSIEIAGSHEMTHEIDRLSLLPNELLDHIFDLAYSIDTPSTGPLSQRLLPFHVTGIYRRIRLSEYTAFLNLVYTVVKCPTLAISIQTLELTALENHATPPLTSTRNDVETFVRSLTRLQTLNIGKGYPQMSWILRPSSSLLGYSDLPALSHLSAPVPFTSLSELHLSLDRFRTLKCLTLTRYDNDFEPAVPLDPTSLPLVTHLTISGIDADDPSIASFCLAFPSLTHLSLYAYEAVYVNLLSALPKTLSHLDLGTIDGDGDIGGGKGGEDCSAQLSKFIVLQHLFLDDNLFSSKLPSHLANLQHLETLKLVGDEIFNVDTVKLLSSPTRPPSLRVIELCTDCITIGSRLEVNETGQIIGVYEPGEGQWQVSKDWDLPEYIMAGEAYGYEEVHEIRKVAGASGVKIRGNYFEALEVVDVYDLEIANIAIYRCFRYNTLEPYSKLQDRGLGSRLPALDLESLDPNNLDLVKTDLPDEGWFALTLE